MIAVQEAVYELTDAGVQVLSPADPRVVDQFGDFLYVASDRVRTIKLVQSRHLAAIEASDFLWLVAPDGYVGQSGAMEIGYAVAVGTPVFCADVPVDLTLRQYVQSVGSPQEALRTVSHGPSRRAAPPNVLLDPVEAVKHAHDELERVERALQSPAEGSGRSASAAARRLDDDIVGPLRGC